MKKLALWLCCWFVWKLELLKAWSIPSGKILWEKLFTCCRRFWVSLSSGISLHLAYFLSKLIPKDNSTKQEGWKWPQRMSHWEMFSVSVFYFHYPVYWVLWDVLSVSPCKVFLLFWLAFFKPSVDLWLDTPAFLKIWGRTNIYWTLVLCQLLGWVDRYLHTSLFNPHKISRLRYDCT